MSCMFNTNDCVPAGTLLHEIAGDSPSPTATPGAAWLYFTGICPPSAKPATVIVIGGAAGAPPRCCARPVVEANTTTVLIARKVRGLIAPESSSESTEREIEPARQRQLRRSGARKDARHAVIPEAR